MNIPTISYTQNNISPKFQANLWVAKSVKDVIGSNEKTFIKAAEMCDDWLKREMGHINKTMTIRQNTSLIPKVAFERYVYKTSYAYPHEETGYTHMVKTKEYEDLEFELGDRKCGFWFNKDSNVEKLFSDFKNMFNHLNSGK